MIVLLVEITTQTNGDAMRAMSENELKTLRSQLLELGLGIDVLTPSDNPDFQKFSSGESETFKGGIFQLRRHEEIIVTVTTRKDLTIHTGEFHRMILLN